VTRRAIKTGRTPLTIALAGALLATLFAFSPASASHATAYAHVYVYHGNTEVAAYQGQVGCTGTPCTITILVTARDYGRFVRWCGTTEEDVTIPYGYAGYGYCYGPSTWYISVPVQINATHAGSVEVQVIVTKT
jgi:hypothetical protein